MKKKRVVGEMEKNLYVLVQLYIRMYSRCMFLREICKFYSICSVLQGMNLYNITHMYRHMSFLSLKHMYI